MLSRLGSLPLWTYQRTLCRRLQTNLARPPLHKPLNVLFLGNDAFSCVVLQQLHAAKDVWDRIDVVTHMDKTLSRSGKQLLVSPMKTTAHTLGLNVVHDPPEKAEFRKWTPPSPYDIPSAENVIVTASFGRILSSPLLDAFLPMRRLNIHPSIVPHYRGSAPIQHTIWNEDPVGGVSVISMGPIKTMPLDAGPIWASKQMPVPPQVTFPELRDSLAAEGGRLLVEVLRKMRLGTAQSIPQTEDPSALHAPRIEPIDGMLDLENLSASQITARARAISHQRALTLHLKWNGKPIQLNNPSIYTPPGSSGIDPNWPLPSAIGTAIFNKPAKALIVRCARDTFLAVPQVKQALRSTMNAREWWNGQKDRLEASVDGVPEIHFLPFAEAKAQMGL